MKVHLFTPDFNGVDSIGHRTTIALSEGLTKLGVDHSVRKTKFWRSGGVDRAGKRYGPEEIADVAVTNGWWKAYIDGRDKINRNTVIRAQEAAGKPAWCIERAFLLDRDVWSAMSIGGFCSNGGDFRAEGMPPDRWDAMGVHIKPWRKEGHHILLCAQVPWDSQVQDGNHLAWLEETIREIRKCTDRPIVFRGHPKAWRQPDPYRELSAEAREMCVTAPKTGFSKPPLSSFEEDLSYAHAVVCYNSNVAVLATVAGVPVFTGAPCLADPIANRDLSQIETPRMDDRTGWMSSLCWKQWHIEEFRAGTPWLHLTRMTHHLARPVWLPTLEAALSG